MTQLILDGIELPESIKDTYKAWREDLGVELLMVSGRLTKEVKGTVWRVSYQHGYFDDATKDALIAACEKGRKEPITCGFLTQEGAGALEYSKFWVTDYTRPKFAWSTEKSTVVNSENIEVVSVPAPIWYDFSVELREVKPSD